jgi:hypothetical protein
MENSRIERQTIVEPEAAREKEEQKDSKYPTNRETTNPAGGSDHGTGSPSEQRQKKESFSFESPYSSALTGQNKKNKKQVGVFKYFITPESHYRKIVITLNILILLLLVLTTFCKISFEPRVELVHVERGDGFTTFYIENKGGKDADEVIIAVETHTQNGNEEVMMVRGHPMEDLDPGEEAGVMIDTMGSNPIHFVTISWKGGENSYVAVWAAGKGSGSMKWS